VFRAIFLGFDHHRGRLHNPNLAKSEHKAKLIFRSREAPTPGHTARAAHYPAGAGSFHVVDIRLNGSTQIARETKVPIAGEEPTTVSMYYCFNAGDYVELTVRQVSGTSADRFGRVRFQGV